MRKFITAITIALFTLGSLGTLAPAAFAEPPSWAPAHGWRAKHEHGHHHKSKRKYEVERAYEHDDAYDDRRRAPIYGDGGGFLRCNRELAGQVVGGAVGAAVGSRFGKGDGQLVATGAGALIGVLLGGEIGRRLDAQDRACVGRTLETVPTGQTVAWRNPDTGADYRTTPRRTYQTDGGRTCREYTTSATVGGRQQQVYGTACRQPDGSWEIVNRQVR
ncbi:MAG: RT0821/Lpp0805 family surface protein [Rhodovibrio sp.]|nr:RT0821/Lpp0805 family surface protein [Rhodovibrio sp.]